MVDPISIGAAAVGAGSNIANSYLNYASNRRGRKIQKREHQYNVAQTGRNLAQSKEDIARGRRQLLESLAARGVEDSTIARDDTGYYDRRAKRMLDALNAQAAMARSRYKHFKKQSKYGKWMDILGMVSQGAGAAGAVGGMMGGGGGLNLDYLGSPQYAGGANYAYTPQ
jgi:hypothetical protein